ncbi:TPA: hypothetical protein P7Z45_001702 [Escherichia coli]|uniref:hypothetical protein n=1 Tax=Escherichia coli TaxID=562 RepID=UPI0019880844|nr:hypothetical protein [Escherichia coli]HDQ2764842.1 hypothetical protein [Escherichia coli]
MNYALIKNNVVVNTVVCNSDNDAKKIFPDYTVVNITVIVAGINWTYDGTTFTAPVIEKSAAELAAENMAISNSEYARATNQIDLLNDQIQDADYTDTTENAVKSALTEWTEYRKSLRAYIRAGDWTQSLPIQPDSVS